tara:strand:- start:112 stop:1701 length:1590 start_codon:yes stop_codon:yes gene_type:complete
MCSINSKKLCNDINCLICFDKSFASSDKAQFFDKDKNNGIEPRFINKQTSNKHWFKCEECNHLFYKQINLIVLHNSWCPYCCIPCQKICNDNNCQICFNKSFASFDKDKVDCWDYNKNKLTPRHVVKNSNKTYWFICNVCNHGFCDSLNHIVSKKKRWCPFCSNHQLCNNNCQICFNKSFASFDKDKVDCWDCNKNHNILPRDIFLQSNNKHWFVCNICNHSFKQQITVITNMGCWCPYCSNKLLCNIDTCLSCYDKSFASSNKAHFFDNDKNNEVNPRQIYKSSGKKYWFKCNDCNHSFECRLDNIYNGKWCPYCANKLLCNNNNCKICFDKSFASSDKVHFFDNDNNNIPRRLFKYSNKKYWFMCYMCNNLFNASLSNVSNGTWCPLCTNKTEKKLKLWFETNNINIIYQPKYDWCINTETNKKLPFDFVIDGKKLIIELDGRQHFEYVPKFKNNVEYNILRDNYKAKCALENNYSMIRIFQEDVFNDNNQWEIQLKKILDDHDNEDKLYIKFIGDKELYQFHIDNI